MPKGSKPDVSDALRLLRESLRLSQGGLGKQLALSGRTIMRWENGHARPSALQARQLVEHTVATSPAVAQTMADAVGIVLPAAAPVVAPPPRVVSTPAAALSPLPRVSIARVHAEVRLAADELDVNARALRRALRTMLAALADSPLTLKELLAMLADEHARAPR